MKNVLSSLSSLTTYVKEAANYNSATLSGAVDVVAVRHDDGTFRSTPWHVRFGKFAVFRSLRKPVKIFVNGEEAPFQMKLGSEGEAYFVQESDRPVDNADYATSPLGSPLSSPEISPQPSPPDSPRSQPDDISAFDLGGGGGGPGDGAAPPRTSRRSASEGELGSMLSNAARADSIGGGLRSRPTSSGKGSRDGKGKGRGSLSRFFRRGRSEGHDDGEDGDGDSSSASASASGSPAQRQQQRRQQQPQKQQLQQQHQLSSQQEQLDEAQHGQKGQQGGGEAAPSGLDAQLAVGGGVELFPGDPQHGGGSASGSGGSDGDGDGDEEDEDEDEQQQQPLMRHRSISTSRPWSSYDAERGAEMVDFEYPPNLEPVRMTVRKTFEQTIAVSSAFQAIVWTFTTRSYNIGFSAEFHVTNEDTGAHELRVVQPPQRVDSHHAQQKGLFLSPCAGILVLKWDNTFSKLRNKNLAYTVYHMGTDAHVVGVDDDEAAALAMVAPALGGRGGYRSPTAAPLPRARGGAADPLHGSIPHAIHFAVDTPFGPGRLAVPCTEASPTVGIHLDTGSDRGHHVVCYCDRSRVKPASTTDGLLDTAGEDGAGAAGGSAAAAATAIGGVNDEDEDGYDEDVEYGGGGGGSAGADACAEFSDTSSTFAWDAAACVWLPFDANNGRHPGGSPGGGGASPVPGGGSSKRGSRTVSPLASPYASPETSSSRPLTELDVRTAAPASDSDDNASLDGTASTGGGGGGGAEGHYFRKSVVPTSEQMEALNLKAGSNTVAFEVYSRLQGRSRIEATLFLWSPTAKVVISDVDGTITKSDVMGHVMFMIGRDWTHNGVAPLYAKIAENGYKFVYLTSRNIGQVDNTKMYLRNISQDECKLPPGAVITSPDRLFAALNREMVQRRPQEFKITALRDVRHCFPNTHNPFYAGFGNRATDVVSYRAVGVAEGRIYIINPKGEIRHFNHMYRASYTSLQELVDVMFPAFSDGSDGDSNAGARKFQDSSFSSYNYWKSNPFQFDDV